MVEKAQKPVIIAGGGVIQTKSQRELIKVAELLKIPVVTAFRRFTAFPNSHPNYIGGLGMGAPSYLTNYIKECDLVLALGTRFSQPTTNNYTLLNQNCSLIHVDVSFDTIGKIYTPDLAIVSNVKEFLKMLLDTANANENKESKNKLLNLKNKYNDFSKLKKNYTEEYANMDGVMYDLSNNLPENSIITNDAGNFFTWLSRYFQFERHDSYVGPTAGAMGYGLPSAIGTKIAHPKRTVVSMSGDGGFMMTINELDTAIRYDTKTLSIVINNSLLGTIKGHQETNFPNREVGTKLSDIN